MTAPQPGILLDPTIAPLFLVLKAGESADDARTLTKVAASLPGWAAGIDLAHEGAGSPRCTVAFGAEFWKRISKDSRPKKLRAFETIHGMNADAVATGGDVFVHVHSARRDLSSALLLRLLAELDGSAEVIEEVQGFRYLDTRDLTGFLDGRENPPAATRAAVTLVDDDDPEFRGGSYVLAQRYVHNLRYWSRLSVEEQEGAIGRTKPDSRKLPDDSRPATSHTSRVVIEEDGEELEIMRHSSPFANAKEQGLYFVAYCGTPDTFDKMLARMFGTSGDGLTDRLMDFTKAVSGALFFAPSADALLTLAE
jgi:putative iron-dependent peroxidase